MENLRIIILAAGKGKRFKSTMPKVLHRVVEKPMIEIVLSNAKNLTTLNNIYIVVGHNKELVIDTINKKFKGVNFVIQSEQKGTGHAVLCCENYMKDFSGYILILCGDMPLVEDDTLKNFIEFCMDKNLDIGVVSSEFENPFGYGRIIRKNGKLLY